MCIRDRAGTAYARGQRLELEILGVDLVELAPQARVVQVFALDEDAASDLAEAGADEEEQAPDDAPAVDDSGSVDAASAVQGARVESNADAAGTPEGDMPPRG